MEKKRHQTTERPFSDWTRIRDPYLVLVSFKCVRLLSIGNTQTLRNLEILKVEQVSNHKIVSVHGRDPIWPNTVNKPRLAVAVVSVPVVRKTAAACLGLEKISEATLAAERKVLEE